MNIAEKKRSDKEKLHLTLLTVSSLSVSYGTQQVLDNVSFSLHRNDHVALVGPNGAGKTTLMRIIAGIEQPDSGVVSIPKNMRVAYVPQAITDLDIDPSISVHSFFLQARGLNAIQNRMSVIEHEFEQQAIDSQLFDEYGTLQNEFRLRGGYETEQDLTVLLGGIGLHIQLDQSVTSLGGGQRSKLFLARAVYAQPDILLMDEPTNHVDEESKKWLADYLRNYPGVILAISHDPDFLNPFINRLLELQPSQPGIAEYKGDYDQFVRIRNERIQQLTSESRRVQEEIDRQRAIAARLIAGSSSGIGKSRQRLAARLEASAVKAPRKTQAMAVKFEIEKPSGKIVLVTRDLGKIYDTTILTYPDMEIQRGHNTAILGPVGAGKSTLLKLLSRRLEPDKGTVVFGSNIQSGYYDPEHAELDFRSTILGELKSMQPDLSEQRLRSVLGHFLFSGDTVFKPIAVLSEGEKSRVALAKLAIMHNNLLILDEPTNHLDGKSKERLLEALRGYQGTLIVVTHDNDLLNGLNFYQHIYLPDGEIRLV